MEVITGSGEEISINELTLLKNEDITDPVVKYQGSVSFEVKEQEIKQALSTLDLMRAQAESLAEQQQLIQYSLEEYTRAKETLSKWKDAKKGEEIPCRSAAISLVFAKVEFNSKALVGIRKWRNGGKAGGRGDRDA